MISDELVDGFLSGELRIRDPFQEEAEEEDEALTETFGSEYPSFMTVQRPNEKKSQVEYRKAYFEQIGNPASGFLGQIEKQIDKIFSSEDYRIGFCQKSEIKRKEDTAEWYFTKGYYNGRNLITSFQETIKRDSLIKPNSVLFVLPNERSTSEYAEPYFVIAESENVLYFKANELCIVKSELSSDVVDAGGNITGEKGDIYYFFDKRSYLIVKHTGYDEQGNRVYSRNKVGTNFRLHGCPFMPAKKIGRVVLKQTEDGHELRTSDIKDSLVFLRNAIFSYMDLRVEHNFHSASQAWLKGYVECGTCNGRGKVKGEGKAEVCPVCNGAKSVPVHGGNGLDVMIVPTTTDELGKTSKTSDVLGGFIERPINGAKLFEEGFEKNIKLALRPFGLEHLLDIPYNQSGTAKGKDMEEGHSFVMSMSEHIGELANMVSSAIVYMRYKNEDKVLIENEIPSISVPKSFNFDSISSLTNKLQVTTDDYLKMRYTEMLVEKESGTNSDEHLYVKAKRKLDPCPLLSFNQKLTARTTLSDIKYILTVNIDAIMTECMEEDKNFLLLDYKTQKEIVYAKAQTLLDEAKPNLDTFTTIKSPVNIIQDSNLNRQ